MNRAQSPSDIQRVKRWKRLNVWSVKGPLLLAALVVGLLSEPLHWGRAPLAAGVAVVLPIIGYREFWTEMRFWITVALLAVVQIPLVMYLTPFIEQYKFPGMLAFGILDCLAVIYGLSLVCSADGKKEIPKIDG